MPRKGMIIWLVKEVYFFMTYKEFSRLCFFLGEAKFTPTFFKLDFCSDKFWFQRFECTPYLSGNLYMLACSASRGHPILPARC
jgi:hypothetical protein